jgi:fucose 4-O-acetylase-like acetyltransferase
VEKIKKREYYLDYLKCLLTVVVIAHHTCQAYSGANAWVYHDQQQAPWLQNFLAVNMTFFMALFFFISGYFLPAAADKRSARNFVANKANHLLFPTLYLIVLIVPVYFYIADWTMERTKLSFFTYYFSDYWGMGRFSYEHGWFIFNLFFYSLIYLLLRSIFTSINIEKVGALNIRKIGIGTIGIVITTILIRLVSPIDHWIDLFGFIGMEPAHLPQYVIMFTAGIIAYRNHWLEQINNRLGYGAMGVGISMSLLIYLKDLLPKNMIDLLFSVFDLYESIMCVSISIGLIFIFRKYLNSEHRLLQRIANCAFGAYIWHNLFVILAQTMLAEVRIPAMFKFVIATIVATIGAFATAFITKGVVRKLNRQAL